MTPRCAMARWIQGISFVVLVGCTTARPAPVSTPVAPPAAPAAPPASVLAQVEASVDLAGTVVGASDARATIVVVFASWCSHCKAALDVLGALRPDHPRLRVLGVNYKAHEEYAERGSAAAVRAYVAASAPWLRVVPADDALFTVLGRPPRCRRCSCSITRAASSRPTIAATARCRTPPS